MIEAILDRHCECLICGARWTVSSEVGSHFELSCCGSVRVREVPGQLLFTDEEGGAWVRRKPRPAWDTNTTA